MSTLDETRWIPWVIGGSTVILVGALGACAYLSWQHDFFSTSDNKQTQSSTLQSKEEEDNTGKLPKPISVNGPSTDASTEPINYYAGLPPASLFQPTSPNRYHTEQDRRNPSSTNTYCQFNMSSLQRDDDRGATDYSVN